MMITIEATYENGVLKPSQPLPLKEHEKVRISVQSDVHHERSPLLEAYGIVGFNGTVEELEYFALSPEFDGLDD
jgi:predicted DNA-binding antitoxin AbrB/MazE fold protein